jgi:uncharacterized protein (TIGR01777 family)
MRVAVTGATGLVGRAVTGKLVARGDEVVALSRDPKGAASSFPAGVRAEPFDVDDPLIAARAFAGADAVVHLAGEPVMARRWNRRVQAGIRNSRVEGTRTIVRAIEEADPRPKALVCASATGYYGHRDDDEIDEDAPAGHDFLAEVARSWEAEAERASALAVRTAILRTGVVLARDGGALPRIAGPFRWFVGGPLGSGAQGFPWIHVEDLAALFLHALDREDLHGPLNAVAPETVSNREFCRALGRAMHRPSFFPVPRLALRLFVGRAAAMLLSGQRAVPRRALESGFVYRFPRLDGALADLFPKEG